MSAALRKSTRVSFEDYLAFEDSATERHELIDGMIFAMAGGTDVHHLIAGNLFLHIAGPLLGRCQVFQGGMKLRVDHQSDSDGYYPDIMVSCSPADRERLFRKEPTLLIEVMSPSTARLDRGEKKLNYLQIPSLLEYVLVAQDIPKVEVMRRSNAWITQELFPGDTLELDSVGLKIPLASIYQTISF
jgi:Uma2 family endonuclease